LEDSDLAAAAIPNLLAPHFGRNSSKRHDLPKCGASPPLRQKFLETAVRYRTFFPLGILALRKKGLKALLPDSAGCYNIHESGEEAL